MLPETELLALFEPIGDNRLYIGELIRQLQSDLGVVPFVGAGMSVPFRLPQWRPFLESLAPTAGVKRNVQEFLDAGEYELAAEYIFEARGANAFHDHFRATFGPEALAGKDLKAAVRLLASFPRGPVITTNFDTALEAVFEGEGCRFDDVITATKLDSAVRAFELNANVLLKIHGSAPDSFDRVLTAQDYERAYGQGPLRWIIENATTRPFLFLGCSLQNDRPLRIWKALVQEGRRLTHHYAVLEQPQSGDELLARLKELTDLHIRPVFFPTARFELIEPLLGFLASKVARERKRNWRRKRGPLVHNLPVPSFQLIGREARLKAVLNSVKENRITMVEGSRGVGKTALVLHSFQRLLNEDTFGALIWSSAALKKNLFGLSDLLDAISRTLDFPFTPQDDKLRLTLAELEKKEFRCLLAVDNYEAIVEREIDDFLTKRLPANCTVLITSAAAVPFASPAIPVIALDELEREDALAFFRQRAVQLGSDEAEPGPELLNALYQTVGGSPLALEWVAGRMRDGAPLSGILESIRSGEAAILDVFCGSWDMLTASARRILCAISLFPAPPLQETVERTCGLSGKELLEGIKQLRRLYLIKVFTMHSTVTAQDATSTRFTMHPITREFVERERGALGVSDLHANAAEYFLSFVRAHGGTSDKEDKQDLQRLNAHLPNILATLEGCRIYGRDACIADLTAAAARWLFIEGHWAELQQWAIEGAAAAEKVGNRFAAGRLHAELGRVYSQRSQFPKAEEEFAKAIAHAAVEPPDVLTLGYVKHHMGDARIRQKRYREARPLLEESLALFTSIPSRRDRIGANYRLAVLDFEEGNDDEARQRLQHGLEDCQTEGWDRLEGFHRRYLGELEIRKPNPDLFQARDYLERATELITETDTRMIALIEQSLARLEERIGNLGRALEKARAARDHFQKLNMKKELEESATMVRRLAASGLP